MSARGVALAFGLLLALPPSSAAAEEAEADEFDRLQELRRQFRDGDYEAAVATGRAILDDEPTPLVRAEAHQYIAASAELLGRTDVAQEHFEELLTLQPTFRLEPSEFPTEVLAMFETVRLGMEDRLRQIEEQRRRAQEAERLERERRLREEAARLAALSRPRYMLRELEQRHLAVAFLPFGAGQFQNEMPERGYAFLGVELGLTAASMVLWLVHATLPDSPADPEAAESLQRGLEYAGYAVYGALAVTVVWGIIDALVNYRPRVERWIEIDEEDVPEAHRLAPERGPAPPAPP